MHIPVIPTLKKNHSDYDFQLHPLTSNSKILSKQYVTRGSRFRASFLTKFSRNLPYRQLPIVSGLGYIKPNLRVGVMAVNCAFKIFNFMLLENTVSRKF